MPSDIAALPSGRLSALDIHRGLLLALMAIDHANGFIGRVHVQEFWGGGLPAFPTAAAMLTRFVTHMAAPGFALLMGVSMVLMAEGRRAAGWSEGRITGRLALRGLLLCLFQILVENRAWAFGATTTLPGAAIVYGGEAPGDTGAVRLYAGVLFALGGAAILWSALRRLPDLAIGALSLAMLAAPSVMRMDMFDPYLAVPAWLRLLLVPGQTGGLLVNYPLLPWAGVVGLGLLLGRALRQDAGGLPRLAGWLAAGLFALFATIRLGGGFGNLAPVGEGVEAFFLIVKYPPSLAFLSLTLGLNLALVAAWPRLGALRWLRVFGEASLFFYLAHLWLLAFLGLAFRGGAGLGLVYAAWAIALLLLWPACRAWARFQRARPASSPWRLI